MISLFYKIFPDKNKLENVNKLGLILIVFFFLYQYFLPIPRFSDQIFVFQQFLGNAFFTHLTIGSGRFAILGIKDLFFLPYFAKGIEEATILMFLLQSLYFILFFLLFFVIAKKFANLQIALLSILFLFIFGNQTELYFLSEFGYASEISICTYFLAFLFFYYKGKETNRLIYYVLAGVLGIFIPYAKETYFIIPLIFVLAKLIFVRKELSKKETLFFYFIILSSAIYIINYFYFAYTPHSNYAQIHGTDICKTITIVIKKCPFYFLSLMIFFIRAYQVLQNKIPFIEADFILLSSIAFISAYIILQMPTLYYFIPGYVLFFLSLAQYIFIIIKRFNLSNFYISILSVILLFPSSYTIVQAKTPQFEMERNISIPIAQFLAKLDLSGHPYISFFPNDPTLFDSILLQHVSGWKGTVIYVFKNYYTNFYKHTYKDINLSDKLKFNFATITTEEQKITPHLFVQDEEKLKQFLDDGGIAVVPDSTTQKMFYQVNPEYKMLDFWWCKIAFNIKIEADVKKYICPMLRQIQKNAGKDFLKKYMSFASLGIQYGCLENFDTDLSKNFIELKKIHEALLAYYQKYHIYPKSEGFQGVNSQWGASKGAIWIDGLVPEFLSELPQGNKKEYLYCSNGYDYKLLLHYSDNIKFLLSLYPHNKDPMRSDYAVGFWTKGASQW